VPCYNEQERIRIVVKELQMFYELNGMLLEVIFVDDGSHDSTVEMLMRYVKQMPYARIVRMKKNGGKWSAVREGMKEAKGEAVLLLDADAGASVNELVAGGKESVASLRAIVRSKTVICGSRFIHGAEVEGKGLLRSVMSAGYRWYVRSMFRYAMGESAPNDPQCPFKLFKNEPGVAREMTVDRFAGDVELFCILKRRGYSFVSVPVDFHHVGCSRVRVSSVTDMFVQTFKVARKQNYLRKSANARGVSAESGAREGGE
jgi:glycosyltransferase involved in cell wall biosynthesis